MQRRQVENDHRKPLTVSVDTASQESNLGRTKIWEMIRDGRLEVVRVDRRTLVIYRSLERLLSPKNDDQASRDRSDAARRLRGKRTRREQVRAGAQ
jgi:hypothetical protein